MLVITHPVWSVAMFGDTWPHHCSHSVTPISVFDSYAVYDRSEATLLLRLKQATNAILEQKPGWPNVL